MIKLNQVLERKHRIPIVYDIYYQDDGQLKPLVVFCHGYKGFKDWGPWHLVAEAFMEAGYVFVKFNFSHNGGTVEQPIDFPDLEAFAHNNYTKELDDLKDMLDHILISYNFNNQIDHNNITLIGHSRGGGIATIFAAEDTRITKLITWAGVSDFGARFGALGDLETWKSTGVTYILNGRTKQQMPHYYQFYEDYIAHKDRLSIEHAAKRIKIPYLIIHAIDDPSVSFSEAEALHSWNPKSQLIAISNSDHVFGGKHPWEIGDLPVKLMEVVIYSHRF